MPFSSPWDSWSLARKGFRRRTFARPSVLLAKTAQAHSAVSDTKGDLKDTKNLCLALETVEAKSVYRGEAVRIRIFRGFNPDLLEPLGVLSWDEATEEARGEYPITYENHEIVYLESGSYQLQMPEQTSPLVLRAGDIAEFDSGVYGNGCATEHLRRRFTFCSPDEWEASLRRVLDAATREEQEGPSGTIMSGNASLQDRASSATQLTSSGLPKPESPSSSEGRLGSKRELSAPERPVRGSSKQRGFGNRTDAKSGNVARQRMDSDLAFPNWVAYALGDFIQIGAAMTLILFWDTGPGTIIPSREINFLLHYIFVPLGTAGACLSALTRILIELVPSLRKHPLARLVPRYEDIDDPRQRHLTDRD